MLLQFAREIEAIGRENINADTRKKSNVLLSCFLQKSSGKELENNTYNRIKGIKCICPFEVSKELTDFYQQPDSVSRLICFENSVVAKHANLCWTSVNLLQKLPCHSHVKQLLGVCTNPPVEKVILHCQNVCITFQKKLVNGTVSLDLVKNIMNEFYLFFQKNIDANLPIFRRLDKFPVIYLLEHSKLVQAKAVVIELSLESQIKPYLYRAPVFYGQYFDVFVKMGAKKKLELSHCVFVLQQLKLKVADRPLLPEEFNVVKKTILNLKKVLNESSSSSAGEGLLFLPNREKVLIDSTKLTVSDNRFYEEKLKDQVTIDYFIGCNQLEIKRDPVAVFSKLPDDLQPFILSKCVQCRVKLDEAQEIEDNERTLMLEEFLHSEEFINGILRLVKHAMITFDEEQHAATITDSIRRVKVVCISHLKCVLIYKGREIPGSEFQRDSHIDSSNDLENKHHTFYIPESVCSTDGSDLKWIMSLIKGLTELIKKCTLCHIGQETTLVVVFTMFEQRSNIIFELDKLGIPSLYCTHTSEKSVFPRPGTYVEAHFHPFLEQAIRPFSRDEYDFAVMELEDPGVINAEDNVEPVYIYVRIKRELSNSQSQSILRKKYLVNTGNLNSINETIPIYRLYRFVRQSEDAGTAVVPYDCEPVTAVAFDETCRRIRDDLQEAWELPERERRRIIMRLKMRWHPDRNPHNQDYCSRVFNYISSVILLLEIGQQVSSVVNDRTGRQAPDMSQSAYHTMVMNANRRASTYTRAYTDNIEDYNRSTRTGRYSHVVRSYEARPDITEAKRWMRQAKQDYKAAVAHMSGAQDVDGFNWICYTCHQACEKVLRAAHYSRDANNMPGKSHSLRSVSWNLGSDIVQQVEQFESRMSDYNRMRYPDAVSRPDIPSELYSEDDAKFALEQVKNVIDKVEECFNIS